MKKIIPILFFMSNIFILSQNYESNAWGGLSVSLSDNLDAINLNPAGLGVDRGNQSGINIQQVNFNSQHSNYHVYSLINRWHCGWAMQNNYDETNKYQWTIGYGTKLANKLYSGFTFNKSKKYSFGMLYRYSNAISTGFTLFSNEENTFRDIRYGLAIRPVHLFKKNKHNNKFIDYSNLTIGYDKIVNYNDNWVESDFKEYFFMNLNIVNGVNIGFKKSQNSDYAISLSLNLGNKGFSLNNYPAEHEESIAANGFGFYSYSQKQQTDINLVNWVWIDTNTILPVDKSNLNVLSKVKSCLVSPDRWGRNQDILKYRIKLKNLGFFPTAVMTSLDNINNWKKNI